MAENVILSAERVSAGYRGKKIVENLSFSVKSGELLILMGPNGAGKSTILKTIAGRLPVLEGRIFLEGKDQNGFAPRELAKKVGAFFPGKLQTEHMSCREIVEMGRYPYTGHFGVLGSKDLAAVEEALERTDTSELADRDFMKLSDGQRQRILLARALCQEPKLLVLDEPTAFLDIRYQLEFLSLLQKLCREWGIAAVLSVHEVELAWRAADRLLFLRKGRMEAFGKPEELIRTNGLQKLFDIDADRLENNGSRKLKEYAESLGRQI